jgi:PKHD-type hydroxylase
MAYFIPKFNRVLNYFCVVNDVFSNEEVDKIIDLEDLQNFSRGTVGSQPDAGEINPHTRDCELGWILPDNRSEWLFQKFGHLCGQVNQDFFLYDIDHLESFQYTIYRENNHYSWHIDAFPTFTMHERKISATILLSDPEDYDGGEFLLVPSGNILEPIVMKPKKGDVIFFASWMPHQVNPVTRGIRKSLVAWVQGKRAV